MQNHTKATPAHQVVKSNAEVRRQRRLAQAATAFNLMVTALERTHVGPTWTVVILSAEQAQAVLHVCTIALDELNQPAEPTKET